LALGKGPVRETAMTGEISLKGKILKIGGIIYVIKVSKKKF
jgi:ATP-dependent Lon protease